VSKVNARRNKNCFIGVNKNLYSNIRFLFREN